MPTLYESYNTGDDHKWGIYATRSWRAQTFTPSVDHIITSVKLKLVREVAGDPGPGIITASIFATDGDGKSTGSVLCSGTTDGDTLPGGSGEWRELTQGSGTLLLAGSKYATVAKSATDDPTHPATWRDDSTSASYAGGTEYSSEDEGATWNATGSGYDHMFEDWGTPEGSSPGGDISPTDPLLRASGIREASGLVLEGRLHIRLN